MFSIAYRMLGSVTDAQPQQVRAVVGAGLLEPSGQALLGGQLEVSGSLCT